MPRINYLYHTIALFYGYLIALYDILPSSFSGASMIRMSLSICPIQIYGCFITMLSLSNAYHACPGTISGASSTVGWGLRVCMSVWEGRMGSIWLYWGLNYTPDCHGHPRINYCVYRMPYAHISLAPIAVSPHYYYDCWWEAVGHFKHRAWYLKFRREWGQYCWGTNRIYFC